MAPLSANRAFALSSRGIMLGISEIDRFRAPQVDSESFKKIGTIAKKCSRLSRALAQDFECWASKFGCLERNVGCLWQDVGYLAQLFGCSARNVGNPPTDFRCMHSRCQSQLPLYTLEYLENLEKQRGIRKRRKEENCDNK